MLQATTNSYRQVKNTKKQNKTTVYDKWSIARTDKIVLNYKFNYQPHIKVH